MLKIISRQLSQYKQAQYDLDIDDIYRDEPSPFSPEGQVKVEVDEENSENGKPYVAYVNVYFAPDGSLSHADIDDIEAVNPHDDPPEIQDDKEWIKRHWIDIAEEVSYGHSYTQL